MRWANVLANLAGVVLNAALLYFAWRARAGDAGARSRLPRIALAMAAMPLVWLVVVWWSMRMAAAWSALPRPAQDALTGGTIVAFFVAFLPSLALVLLFRRRG